MLSKILKKTNWTFVLFHDKDKSNPVRTYNDYHDQLFRKLNKQGWGVYFAVNDFAATNEELTKHNTATVRNAIFLKKLIAVFADLDIAKAGDGTPDDEKQKRKNDLAQAIFEKCEPSAIIETANGLQPLWVINEPSIDPDIISTYTATINGIIEWSKQHGAKGDAVKDVTRVLRLPGFDHMKEQPYPVTLMFESEQTYSLQELAAKFSIVTVDREKKTTGVATSPAPAPRDGYSRQFEEVQRLDIKDIVVAAFAARGQVADFDRTGRLILDGRLTGTFKGRQCEGYLASTSHEPYKGNRITVVADILEMNYKEAYRWLLDCFHILPESEYKKREAVHEQVIHPIPPSSSNQQFFTWGADFIDRKLGCISTNDLVVLAGYSGVGKTEFCYFVARANALRGKVCYLTLELSPLAMMQRIALRKAGISKYDYQLGQYTEEQSKIFEAEKCRFSTAYPNLHFMGSDKTLTIDEIEATIEQQVGLGCRLFFIDTLGNVAPKGKQNEFEAQADITRQLQLLKNRLQIAIILVHHLRKAVGSNSARPGGATAIRGSGKILDNATLVCEFRRDLDPEQGELFKNNATFLQYKDTNFGVLGAIDLRLSGETYLDGHFNG